MDQDKFLESFNLKKANDEDTDLDEVSWTITCEKCNPPQVIQYFPNYNGIADDFEALDEDSDYVPERLIPFFESAKVASDAHMKEFHPEEK